VHNSKQGASEIAFDYKIAQLYRVCKQIVSFPCRPDEKLMLI